MIMKEWTPEQIRDFRKRLNLYQKDFAVMLKVTRTYIVHLEKGVKTPGDMLRAFLDCLEEKHTKTKKKGR